MSPPLAFHPMMGEEYNITFAAIKVALCLVGLIALTWFLKRRVLKQHESSNGSTAHLRVVRHLPLSRSTFLAYVETEQSLHLLACSDGGVTVVESRERTASGDSENTVLKTESE